MSAPILRQAWALAAALLAGGCASFIPDKSIDLTPGTHIQLEKLVNWGMYVGVAYLVLDPLAPNWNVAETSFPDDQFHLALHMKRYYAGGAGEARVVFHRRAQELARSGGFGGYDVLEYQERLESSVLGAQRAATGVVRLTGRRLD